jgi:hypothetical protein
LAWYRELLHPSAEVEKKGMSETEIKHGDERVTSFNKMEQRHSTDSATTQESQTAHSSWPPKLIVWYHTLRSFLIQQHTNWRQVEDDFLLTTPPTYHPLLRPTLSPKLHYLLLSIYDTILIIVLTLHIFVFFSLMFPLIAFCRTSDTLMYPDSNLAKIKGCIDSLDPDKAVDCPPMGMQERCERMNWNIHGAGGFSGAVAAILAGVHLVAILCRISEMGVVWLELIKMGMKKRRVERDSVAQEAPRDVDIHTRGRAKKGTGRLTIISEEERDTGGEGTQKKDESENNSESQQSKTSSGVSGTLGDVLLECLVP